MAPRAFECGEGEALIAGRDMLILWGRERAAVYLDADTLVC